MVILSPRLVSPRLVGMGSVAAPKSEVMPTVKELRPAGRCPHGVSLLVVIMDNSGSVTSPGGADPVSNRFSEVKLALEAVAAVCRCGREYAALVTFDTPVGDVDATPIRKGLPGIAAKLRVHSRAQGASDLLPAVTTAKRIIARVGADHVTTVVLSDFALTDTDPNAALAALGEVPGRLIAATLGHQVEPGGLGRAEIVPITSESRPGSLARLLVAAAATYRT